MNCLLEEDEIVIETPTFLRREATDMLSPVPLFSSKPKTPRQNTARPRIFGQLLRFGMVGGLNTLVDLLILNGLLWLFPTHSSTMLLIYNAFAYGLGAVNSFFLNKYWTFGMRRKTTRKELTRFSLTTLCGMAWSSVILWLVGTLLHPYVGNATLWANASKATAIVGTVCISYLGMRLWVFVKRTPAKDATLPLPPIETSNTFQTSHPVAIKIERNTAHEYEFYSTTGREGQRLPRHSLSLVLPAFNEEAVIGTTLLHVLSVLTTTEQVKDFEIIVINDGSADRTGAIVSALAKSESRIRLLTHEHNQGYGATLVDGFAAATKELTLFMDSDGQFDLYDLDRLLPFIDTYDAVIGYRFNRQDTWLRKFNAWGWKMLIRQVLGISARDIDCAFKLLHTDFLQQHPLETRGAMINAELLYKLQRANCTYREVNVQHLPRQGGRATGAKLSVIVRAFRELFSFARKWRREEGGYIQQRLVSKKQTF